MYRYDEFDRDLVLQRVEQFRGQVARRLKDELSEDEFRPLRLQNGLYYQKHAYMLRVAIPYGLLSSKQLRMLGTIADKYDRGYGHFSTRQNIQYNWLELEQVPDILQDLASVEMHAIQTSGNCVRNITTDQFAGVAQDEFVDPRPIAEVLRQWSTFHPEFAYLPRKFKIAISASAQDRAATQLHDIGLYLRKNDQQEVVVDVLVGGGMGRTPIIGTIIRRDLPLAELFTYCEAILRVYNLHGRRDNIYKARIKILLRALGAEEFTRQVEAEWQHVRGKNHVLTQEELARVQTFFTDPPYKDLPIDDPVHEQHLATDKSFARWVSRCVFPHKKPGYAAVTLSLKPHGTVAPGDATGAQMRAVADWADAFSFGEIRVTHEQNLVLADVEQRQLYDLWQAAKTVGLATPNIGLATDMICCPGGDFCALANAPSIPLATAIQNQLDDYDYLFDLGELSINISGCINSCGHHHIGNIGILGVDKDGSSWYQVSLGGAQGNHAQIGKIIGPSFSAAEIPAVIATILETYLTERLPNERFVDCVDRIGVAPFKAKVYAS